MRNMRHECKAAAIHFCMEGGYSNSSIHTTAANDYCTAASDCNFQ